LDDGDGRIAWDEMEHETASEKDTLTNAAPERRSTWRPRAFSTGIRARLIAIVLVPIMGIMTWATVSVTRQAKALARTQVLATEIDQLSEVIAARITLDQEYFPTQVRNVVRQYDLPGSFTSMIMGFNPDTEIVVTRAESDLAFQKPALERYQPKIADLRSLADDSRASTFDAVHAKFRAIDEDLKARSITMLNKIDRIPAGSTIESQLDDLVNTLVNVSALSNATTEQTHLLFELQSLARSDREIRSELAAADASAAIFIREVDEHAGPITLKALKEFRSDSSTILAGVVVHEALTQETSQLFSGAIDVSALTAAAGRYKSLLHRSDLARGLLTTTIEENGLLASSLRRNADNDMRQTLMQTAVLTLLSILIALYFARSISKPLLLLARRADAIRSGQLVGAPLDQAGPKEITAVTRAVNELVENLTLLDQQASSLAAGDLDSPALSRQLPGGLGVSMQATVDRLSSSIRNREELQLRLLHQASHDDLTGLPNRQSLTEFVDAALARSRRSKAPMAALFIDLDGFKSANDIHGHRFGDQVLILCAERLRASLRAGDFVARIGGDEFVIVAENLNGADEALRIADRFIDVLSQPVSIENKAANIGASIGIAIDLDGTATATALMRDADFAVYRAKASGRGHAELFDNTLRTEMEQRADVENAMLEAIRQGQLRLDYQPIVHVGPYQITDINSVEALIRWDRPGVGLVSPDYFIPLLESSPRMIDLGRWVLIHATKQLEAWSSHELMKDLSLTVNVSPRHLVAASFVADVTYALERSNIDPQRLVLEITETSLLDNVAVAAEHLAAVRALGIRIALDDFGTGFTSIRQLGELPIDILKIDRSFIGAMADRNTRTIVEMMVGVGKALGLLTVAEGVETPEQMSVLSNIGCFVHQGYLYHRPMRPDALEAQMTSIPVALTSNLVR
jgi:diguanylate cyclase (GGDEF)-like protein